MEQVKVSKQMLKSNVINFYSLLNRPKTVASEAGKGIYEWTYQDETGKLCKDKRNVYELIQSYARQVDYKEKIKRGEEINDGEGNYLDISELGDGYLGFNEYIANVVNSLQQSIQEKPIQNQNGEDNSQNPKAEPESKETTEQGTASAVEGEGK